MLEHMVEPTTSSSGKDCEVDDKEQELRSLPKEEVIKRCLFYRTGFRKADMTRKRAVQQQEKANVECKRYREERNKLKTKNDELAKQLEQMKGENEKLLADASEDGVFKSTMQDIERMLLEEKVKALERDMETAKGDYLKQMQALEKELIKQRAEKKDLLEQVSHLQKTVEMRDHQMELLRSEMNENSLQLRILQKRNRGRGTEFK